MKGWKNALLTEFAVFATENHGIESLFTSGTDDSILQAFSFLSANDSDAIDDSKVLTFARFNQLLALSHARAMTYDFFKYYWCLTPKHTYNIKSLPGYEDTYSSLTEVRSRAQLKWGLTRLYIDCLMYFGNIREGFRHLCVMDRSQLSTFFRSKRYNTQRFQRRGAYLPLKKIEMEYRPLIAEQACKILGYDPQAEAAFIEDVKSAYAWLAADTKRSNITAAEIFKHLGTGSRGARKYKIENSSQGSLFEVPALMSRTITNDEEVDQLCRLLVKALQLARRKAAVNTNLYLSMVSEMDVYVATSMGTRAHFLSMAKFCEDIFNHSAIRPLRLRYFDPTISAAEGHEDKGLIECLMVKCAKLLIYCAGDRASYGKDAEAAMALSLGKPVIFYCEPTSGQGAYEGFYRDVHPLSRLIEFDTGVAVGAIVSADKKQVIELVRRIFHNEMDYVLEQKQNRSGYLLVKERLTDSVVRLQTNDKLLTESFWNYYHTPADQSDILSKLDVERPRYKRRVPRSINRPRPS